MSILDKFRRRRPPEPPEEENVAIVRREEPDLENMTLAELEQHEALLRTRIAQRQADLLDLTIQEKRYNVHRGAREMLIEKYLQDIRALEEKLWREKGEVLRSIHPQEGDDPELVAEAWRIFCAQKRGAGSRFG